MDKEFLFLAAVGLLTLTVVVFGVFSPELSDVEIHGSLNGYWAYCAETTNIYVLADCELRQRMIDANIWTEDVNG